MPFLIVIWKKKFTLPLGDGSESDRVIWPLNHNGDYSVKSGYHLIHSSNSSNVDLRPSSLHAPTDVLWKVIWNSPSIPKLKNFLWRVLSGCLASKENLFMQHLGDSPICPLCEQTSESLEHLFLLCDWVKLVWFGSPMNYYVDRHRVTSMAEWLYDTNVVSYKMLDL